MKLVKTLELPGGRGQHFFLDMGNGVDGIAFFWFPEAPEGVRGESLQDRVGMTAIGTMNHLAFDVRPEKFDEYRAEAASKGVEGHRDHQPLPTRSRAGTRPTTTRPPTTATCSCARCTSPIRTARCSSSPRGLASSETTT